MSTTTPTDRLDVLTAEVHRAYTERTAASRSMFERARAVLPGGVSGTVRHFAPHPLYCVDGHGAHEVDLDGNEYIDHFLCGACLLLGHRPPELADAVGEAARLGSLVLNPERTVRLAEHLVDMIPGAEQVRLLNSGSEAVMTALRVARAVTGRSVVIKFLGTYHGQFDQVLTGLGSRPSRLGRGIPDSQVADIELLAFGDLEALAARLSRGDVAAVLVDPSMHHAGLWSGSPDLYARIRELAHSHGALMIFDEVISGFRLAPGGAQEYFAIEADLAVFGKALAAGERLGALTGRSELMRALDPVRDQPGPFAFQSGTGNDATAAVASALAATTAYARLGADGSYAALNLLAAQLAEGLTSVFAEQSIGCQANQLGPMVRLFLTPDPVDLAGSMRLDRRVLDLFHLALITEGVLTIPGSNDFFFSFAHRTAHVATVIGAARRVLAQFDFAGAIADTTGAGAR